MGKFDDKIFGKTKFSDILQEIHENQNTRGAQIISLIQELKPLIEDIGDATLVVPLIKEYMELGIKNDEVLVKMATIVQRATQNKGGDVETTLLTEEEKAQLLGEIKNLPESTK